MNTDSNDAEMREVPWHELGFRLRHAATAADVIRTAGINWRVATKETFVGKEHRIRPGHVLVREDLWNTNKGGILGSVPSSHVPMQNIEAFGFLDDIIKSGSATYDSAGALDQGKRIWTILHFQNDLQVASNDFLSKYLLLVHSPTTGYHRLTYLPCRQVCQNTVTEEAFHNPPPFITTPHVRPRRFQVPIEVAIEEIQRRFDDMAREFKAMLKVKLGQDRLEQYVRSVFDDWHRKLDLLPKDEGPSEIGAHTELGRKECLRLFVEGKGNDMPDVKGTLWAALSGIAEYNDFHSLRSNDPKHLPEVWFGKLKASALKVAKAMIA